jgi:hypothetical protein
MERHAEEQRALGQLFDPSLDLGAVAHLDRCPILGLLSGGRK